MTERHVGADRLAQVVGIDVEVGSSANIECANLEFCLNALLGAPPFGNARATLTPTSGADLVLAHIELNEERAGDGPVHEEAE